MFAAYFQTVDFDFSVGAMREGEPAAYFGFTLPPDSGLCKLIASAIGAEGTDAIAPSLAAVVAELRVRNARILATKALPGDEGGAILSRLGFRHETEEVFLFKNI